MTKPNDLFKKIAEAQNSRGSNYIPENTHWTLVVRELTINDGFKGRSAIHKLLVHEMTPTAPGALTYAKGTPVVNVILLDAPQKVAADMAMRNVKDFVLAVMGVSPGEVTDDDLIETLQDIYNPNTQHLRGFLVGYRMEPSKKTGKQYPRFFQVPNSPEEVAERARELK